LQAIVNKGACLVAPVVLAVFGFQTSMIQKQILPKFSQLCLYRGTSPCCCKRHRTTSRLRTWQKTVNSCLSLGASWTARLSLRACVGHQHVPWAVKQHVLVTAHSLLLDFAFGTVSQPICKSPTLHSNNFNEHSKTHHWVTVFFCALCTNWLT